MRVPAARRDAWAGRYVATRPLQSVQCGYGRCKPCGLPRTNEGTRMRLIVLWLLGVPLGVIILLKLFGIF
jgi:hypothetical protein